MLTNSFRRRFRLKYYNFLEIKNRFDVLSQNYRINDSLKTLSPSLSGEAGSWYSGSMYDAPACVVQLALSVVQQALCVVKQALCVVQLALQCMRGAGDAYVWCSRLCVWCNRLYDCVV